MQDKIMSVYLEFLKKTDSVNEEVVILVSPKTMNKLREEQLVETTFIREKSHNIMIFGKSIAIFVENTIPENVQFIIGLRKDFEREEKEKQFKRFFKMFGD